mmetsp:Transcript_4692/g.10129  ORF Transcript_4692/g.10129 Transcript_4692/m.10129 type:complete len:88 (-) Transcript_4692:246-509(-)
MDVRTHLAIQDSSKLAVSVEASRSGLLVVVPLAAGEQLANNSTAYCGKRPCPCQSATSLRPPSSFFLSPLSLSLIGVDESVTLTCTM